MKFELKVLIYTRPNLRDDDLEMERFIGRSVLDSIFDKMEMRPDVKDLFLSFPEQWLNILEQRCLYQRLEHYCPNLITVTIKTHSVYIVQCTYRKNCGIVDNPSSIQEGNAEENITRKLYHDLSDTNLIKMDKINVL